MGHEGWCTGLPWIPGKAAYHPMRMGVFIYKYPPPIIYFKPDMETQIIFEGVPKGIIPILPLKVSFSVCMEGGKIKLERRQIAIIPGYTFTDYKAQGQTMECVIVDISKPPSAKLSPFNIYVALLRSRGWETIHILRDFDPELLMHHLSEDLRVEMARLECLDEKNKGCFKRNQ